MKAIIKTKFNTNSADFWQKLSIPSSLVFVAAPLLQFRSDENIIMSEPWQLNRDYRLKLYLLGLLPLGRHLIRLVKIDQENNIIESRESGWIARNWNHVITFKEQGDHRLQYSDEIEIRAGLLTPLVWLFAHIFYRHRQRRWRRLLLKEK